jgi:uncharacterized protein YdhG (YjbR/CyaY superfamily)
MKKTKTGKTANIPRTVAEYLTRVPEPARGALKEVRALVRKIAPPETTEEISYGIPTFKYKGTLMSFAAFSDHCSLFPGAGPTLKFKDELKNFETSKGTIRFVPDKPLSTALLKKLVKARISENEHKKGR